MLRGGLGGSRQGKDLVFGPGSHGEDLSERWMAFGERAGLVEHHRGDLAKRLEGLASAH